MLWPSSQCGPMPNDQPIATVPTHPEEMGATFELRIGKSVALQGTAHITPAVIKRLGLSYVTPHSARHSFISTLQAQGIEVGLVAKIADHANPTVTLGHYRQAVRGGEAAIEALDRAYISSS
jgi:integrase